MIQEKEMRMQYSREQERQAEQGKGESAVDLFLSKFKSFTEIQKLAIPVVSKGINCIITAPTGSGKTEAALLPVLDMLSKSEDRKGIGAIYITPLRALNRDLLKRIEWLTKGLGISMAVRHGDTPQTERQKQAAKPPQLLITTPESMQNLFLSPRLRNALSNVKAVIVDELHELYSNKRGAQLAVALERLEQIAHKYQRIGISATIGNDNAAEFFLCPSGQCELIKSSTGKELNISIEMPTRPLHEHKQLKEQFGLNAQAIARLERIAELVRMSESTLIFANTRQVVESLGSKLIYLNSIEPFGGIGVHHSSLDKSLRVEVENEFKEGKLKSIIATSSLELGIDIGTVNLVVQYGSPKQAVRLVQRVGRGGHREKEAANGKIIVANAIDALESLAITIEANKRELEKQEIETNALDVLVNQICAIALEYKEIEVRKVKSIVTSAAPYVHMPDTLFESVLSFAAAQHLVNVVEGKIRTGARTRDYFYKNISVIPEISKFLVKEVANNKIVATLDESFVSGYLDQGTVFITKGIPWKVVDINNNIIYVERSKDLEAAVPDWEGEDIPVTRQTASKVFELLQKGVDNFSELLDNNSKESIDNLMTKQKGFFTPSEDMVVVEESDDYAMIYVPYGKQANELIARLLSYALSISAGTKITTTAMAYAIIVKYRATGHVPKIERMLKSGALLQLLNGDAYLTNSDLFLYKFVQVAKLMGIVDKDASVTRSNALKLIGFYKSSPAFEEAKRDLIKNYFDLKTAVEVLEKMKKGEIKIRTMQGISPLGTELLKERYLYGELVTEAPSEEEINVFEREVIGKNVELLCTYCGFVFETKTKDKDERILCPRCKSPMLCIYSDEKAEVLAKKRQGKELNEKEQEIYSGIMKETSLVEAYGNRALIAFSTYGVGVTAAAKVLKMLRKSYREMYIDLLNAQKNFIRTKKFWKEKQNTKAEIL